MPETPLPSYDPARTALLFVDPYNDFLDARGKLWPLVAAVAEQTNLHANLRIALGVARAAGFAVFIVPHRQWEPGDYADWDHPTPYQLGAARHEVFARGSWGAEWYPDFAPRPGDTVVKEHWGGSGFANTDLDLRLKQRCITHVVLVGLIANTCIESTGRFASELGYHVTLVRDATAAASPEALHSAHEINGPTFAHAILTTQELVAALAVAEPA
ncbi:isochorismatase family cysteine hydrolase [Sphingomonas sp.]|uniref:cysteine hydrolase family protein n=1 Tax=Sphingomonas sp. TaxID=28214 RepID=UPI001B13EDC6|nr:isochorismatase family cysteine hydrolase [Sphingomonas sp.]MBO9714270.1 cysteine hydrolase [Sphingomonas sp.]